MPKGKKRGRPKKLEAKKDFSKPTRKQEQGTLELKLAVKEPEKLVRNRRMQFVYVKPHFDRNKKGNRYVALECSAALTPEHLEYLPAPIAGAYHDVAKKNRNRIDLSGIKPHAARFFLTHDDSEASLDLPAAWVSHARLQVIEETGSGKANKVIRLSLRLRVPLSRDVAHFSEWNFGDTYWLKIEEAQGHLLEDEDDEAEEASEEEAEDADEEQEELAKTGTGDPNPDDAHTF